MQVERLISAAATLARAWLDAGFAVGLYVNGAPAEQEHLARMAPSRSAAQLGRIMESKSTRVTGVHTCASALPWAPDDVFSFVLYHKQRTWSRARDEVGTWTRELIALALQHGGRHYLPYQLHATVEQFDRAYPEAAQFRRTKQQVDPTGKLSNELWRKYL